MEDDDFSDGPAMPVPADPNAPPEMIVELASACIEYVQRATGIIVDLTPDTLPIVDHYLSLSREPVGSRSEVVPLVTRAVGAYFGELVRRSLGGFWFVPSANVQDWLVCARRVFLSFNPIGVVYEALHLGTDHEGPSSRLRIAPEAREVVSRRLADLPEVSEADYYLLSTRFEALEFVADAISGEQTRRGYEDVEFELGDYVQEMRALGDA
jgi:hypothetical protein